MYINNRNGEIVVHTGTMFSGKTSALLAHVRKCKIAGLSVLLLKPSIDNRYSEVEVATHYNDKLAAKNVSKLSEVRDLLRQGDYDVIAVDEFQFLDLDIDLREFLIYEILVEGKKFIVAGLTLDKSLKPFNNLKEIMPYATSIHKIESTCGVCKEPAHYVHCNVNTKEQVLVGGEGMYTPKCFNCFYDSEDSPLPRKN